MGVSWVAVEARTGNLIADLPDLECDEVSQTLGRYEVASAALPVTLSDAPADWERATRKGSTALILLEDNPLDPAHGIPLWGGLITRRRRGSGSTVLLDLITAEGYLDRRFTGDETFAAVDQNTIVETLIDTYIADGVTPGLPIRVEVVGDPGQTRDRTYFDYDDKTIYAILRDLAGVISGPEWTIGWEWQTGPERLTPVLYVGDRVGSSPLAGLAPAATFDMPGCVSSFELLEDYGRDTGANDVMAVSSGEGDLRPQSPRQTDFTDDLMPAYEYRWTPSTSITEVDTLTAHAEERLPIMANGTTGLSLSASVEAAPRLGVDWFIGDDVGYDVGGLAADGVELAPQFPGGIRGVARCAGWSRTLGVNPMVTPVLVSSDGSFG